MPKTNSRFTVFFLCRVSCLCDAMRHAKQQEHLQRSETVIITITNVMAVLHFVSRSRLIAPKGLATN